MLPGFTNNRVKLLDVGWRPLKVICRRNAPSTACEMTGVGLPLLSPQRYQPQPLLPRYIDSSSNYRIARSYIFGLKNSYKCHLSFPAGVKGLYTALHI